VYHLEIDHRVQSNSSAFLRAGAQVEALESRTKSIEKTSSRYIDRLAQLAISYQPVI
jgi:hypothetical protein